MKKTLACALSTLFLLACGAGSPGPAGDAQTPPTTGRTAVEAWLTAGSYKTWKCEAAAHAARSPSPHGMNRICSNTILSSFTGTGEYPLDSAGVKELYDSTGATIVGYAVYRHVKAGNDGTSWYYYERVPADSKAPHDANGVVADRLGGTGAATDTDPANTICTSCHQAAGSDSGHSGHNFVYTQVK